MTRQPGADPQDPGLEMPENVRGLVDMMSARVAEAATPAEIRQIADRAAREARDNPLKLSEIEQLARVAQSQAEQVNDLMRQLAELGEGPTRG
jgi:hypothetical protein